MQYVLIGVVVLIALAAFLHGRKSRRKRASTNPYDEARSIVGEAFLKDLLDRWKRGEEIVLGDPEPVEVSLRPEYLVTGSHEDIRFSFTVPKGKRGMCWLLLERMGLDEKGQETVAWKAYLEYGSGHPCAAMIRELLEIASVKEGSEGEAEAAVEAVPPPASAAAPPPDPFDGVPDDRREVPS